MSGRSRPLIGLMASLLLLPAAAGGTIAWSATVATDRSAVHEAHAEAVRPGAPRSGSTGPTCAPTACAVDPAPSSPASARSWPELVGGTASTSSGGASPATPPTPRRPTSPDRAGPDVSLVVYVPHQDDELLSLGVVIARHALAGDGIRVVLLTDGSASSARERVNRRLAGLRLPGLTRPAFAAARDREFLASLAALGVPAASVTRVGLADGRLSESVAWTVIRDLVAAYPKALHVTTSASDVHRDHLALARALVRARAAGAATAWAVARPFWRGRASDPACHYLADPAVDTLLAAGVSEYLRWDPSAGRYGVAGNSVPGLLADAVADPRDLLCDRP